MPLWARLLLSLLCLVGGCGISGYGLIGVTVTASTGYYPSASRDALIACIPALLGVAVAVALLARGRGGAPPSPTPR